MFSMVKVVIFLSMIIFAKDCSENKDKAASKINCWRLDNNTNFVFK